MLKTYKLAKLIARDGHNLVVIARNREKLNQPAAELQADRDIKVKVIVKDLAVAAE